MSFVELRIELPAYAHSFLIHVPHPSTIAEVKQEIFRACPGGPRPGGQRLIWRGRYLLDHELIEQLWRSRDEPRIIHLAVHPSAWSSKPPDIPQLHPVPSPNTNFHTPHISTSINAPIFSGRSANPTLGRSMFSGSMPTALPIPQPMAYVQIKHEHALHVLMHGTLPATEIQDIDVLRLLAKHHVERCGYMWAPELDDAYPTASPGGVRYEQVVIDGESYLSLCDPSESPTPIQEQALKVITYTFPLLFLPSQLAMATRVNSLSFPSFPPPPHINQLLQQFGLPPLRAVPDRNQPPPRLPEIQVRRIALRPLLAPFVFLIFRTVLLFYFVAPARKPIFGILVFAWMLWEIWIPIRNGMLRGWRRAEQEQRGNDDVGNGEAGPAAGEQGDQVGNARARNGPIGPGFGMVDQQANAILENLGSMNIQNEEGIIARNLPHEAEPSIGHKIITFISLLVTTLHPAVWNRRRAALRQREGRIRTEASARTTPPPAEGGQDQDDARRTELHARLIAQHARRPQWLQRYIDRVVASDWVDDAD